jgi:intracellular sulfur oxidation DsrE/DsrF family protein
MSQSHSALVPRRSFLLRLSQAAAAVTAILSNPARLAAEAPNATPPTSADPDAWIARMRGDHKVIIHAHQYFMTALVDARTMLANAREAYGVPESQFSLAVVTHGPAIQGLFTDATWENLSLGTFYKVNDPKTGAPSTRNFYLTPQDGEPADAAVNDLVKRGVTFVVCNVALKNLANKLAKARNTTPEAVYPQLASGLVDGAFLVPDVFVSMQRAQKRGVAYVFTDRSR